MSDEQRRESSTSNKQTQRYESMESKDLMISYSHQDRDRMRQVRGEI